MHLVHFQQLQNSTINSAAGEEEKPGISEEHLHKLFLPAALLLPKSSLDLASLLPWLTRWLLPALLWERYHPKQQIQTVRIHLFTSYLGQQEDEQYNYSLIH